MMMMMHQSRQYRLISDELIAFGYDRQSPDQKKGSESGGMPQ